MSIGQDKLLSLEKEMSELGISENDLIEKFILGTGSGGQKINKSSTTVYLKHIPTGIEVKCQKGRSQALNRYYARKELIEKIKKTLLQVTTKKEQAAAKIKRQKKRKTRRQKQKMIDDKKHTAKIKSGRRPPKEG